jgi:hypothetical protein
MHVTYTPEDPADGDRQEWTVSLGRMRQSEAVLLEKTFGGTKDEFDIAVQRGDSHARRVLLWHLMRQDHPRMPFKSTPDFFVDEIEIELGEKELEKLRGQIAKAPQLTEFERTTMLDALEAQLAEVREKASTIDGDVVTGDVIDGEVTGAPGVGVEPAGKARSRTRPTATG